MKLNTGIYRIRNAVTGKVYIGSAANFPRRFALHRCNLRAGKHKNTKLQNAWNKHGEAAFVFERLLVCAKESLIDYEQACINGFNAVRNGYNVLPVAGSALGFRHSEAHRERLRGNKNALGNKHRPETLAKLSEASKGNAYGLGYKHTDAARKNISDGLLGIKQSPEWVEKRIAAHRGAKRSPQAIENMRAAWARRKQASAS